MINYNSDNSNNIKNNINKINKKNMDNNKSNIYTNKSNKNNDNNNKVDENNINKTINKEKLPNKPGCYIFKDNKDVIIYIGKAKNLKNRVSSYFSKIEHDNKTKNLIENIHSFDFIITDNEKEAYILENTLIKKHKPKYNIDLKDSKRYSFIKITNEKFKRITIARKIDNTGEFFGPFILTNDRNNILNALKKIFKLRTCKKMPKKPCLRYHINLCNAPCANFISKEEYEKNISKVKEILSGKINDTLKTLETEMLNYSKEKKYEKALETKNTINSLKVLIEKQNMEKKRDYNEDIINFIINEEKVNLIIFNIYKGTLENKKEFEFDYKEGFFDEFILQYYSQNPIPKKIFIPIKVDKPLEEYLFELKKSKVELIIPKKGQFKELLELAKLNLENNYLNSKLILKDMMNKLELKIYPKIIECFDISHLSGSLTVASMVQFNEGIENKQNYRRFKIKSIEQIDDFAAISEVTKRRYTRLLNEKKQMPNLIIIDGGKGQLSSAIYELNKLKLKIPIISIAKKLEEIFLPNKSESIKLNEKDKVLLLIRKIRDEAHRFAISYNKMLRKKEMFK
jgi:excinuclease ABC subunit C